MLLTAVTITGIVICLLGCFAGFAAFTRKKASPEAPSAVPAALTVLFVVIISAAALPSVWQSYDSLAEISALSYIAAAIGLIIIIAVSFAQIRFWQRAIITAATISGIVFLTSLAIIFNPAWPMWLNKILTIILWCVTTFSLRILNGNPALPAIELATLGFGAALLWMFSVLPQTIGIIGLYIGISATALTSWTWYPAKLRLSASGTDILGFIAGFLIVFSGAEGAVSCFYIFALYPVCEIIWAGGKKLTFLPAFADTLANTAYSQADLSGLSPALASSQIIRINFLFIMFGCFQAFAPNEYSVPLFCTLLGGWQLYRLMNWNAGSGTLQEANKEFVSGLKKNIDNLKNSFQKTDRGE